MTFWHIHIIFIIFDYFSSITLDTQYIFTGFSFSTRYHWDFIINFLDAHSLYSYILLYRLHHTWGIYEVKILSYSEGKREQTDRWTLLVSEMRMCARLMKTKSWKFIPFLLVKVLIKMKIEFCTFFFLNRLEHWLRRHHMRVVFSSDFHIGQSCSFSALEA